MKSRRVVVWGALCAAALSVAGAERRISVADFRDKAEAAWLGQIAGVCWGAPTELKWNGAIIPADKMPQWAPEMINHAFGQDDLYVEMTFLRTLEQYGLDVSIRQAGLDFANSQYKLWCANRAGRTNLRAGIAPPDSGHPTFNSRGNDIDYQIEADYAGIISPGLPNSVIALGEKFGRLMNYGDGVLGGVFMGAMYAEAYFTTDRMKLIEAGLAAIPAESDYAEMARQVVAWYHEDPNDWQGCWRKIEAKYHPEGKSWRWRDSNGGIDARIDGAQVLLGLLYGKGDLDQTIIIATRGGYDSDCNPSSAAGPLFATLGRKNLPARFTEKLVRTTKFSYTEYTFDGLLAVTEKLAREIVVQQGGRVEKDAQGTEWFVIPERQAKPRPYTPTWKAEPPLNVKFTQAEMAQQKFALPQLDPKALSSTNPTERVQLVLDKLFPGWTTSENALDMHPGFLSEYEGQEFVLRTHPPARKRAVTLSRRMTIPTGDPRLVLKVANAAGGDFDLVVRVGGVQVLRTNVGWAHGQMKGSLWQDVELGLQMWAGKNVLIEVDNQPTDWLNEAAHWKVLEVQANNQ